MSSCTSYSRYWVVKKPLRTTQNNPWPTGAFQLVCPPTQCLPSPSSYWEIPGVATLAPVVPPASESMQGERSTFLLLLLLYNSCLEFMHSSVSPLGLVWRKLSVTGVKFQDFWTDENRQWWKGATDSWWAGYGSQRERTCIEELEVIDQPRLLTPFVGHIPHFLSRKRLAPTPHCNRKLLTLSL